MVTGCPGGGRVIEDPPTLAPTITMEPSFGWAACSRDMELILGLRNLCPWTVQVLSISPSSPPDRRVFVFNEQVYNEPKGTNLQLSHHSSYFWADEVVICCLTSSDTTVPNKTMQTSMALCDIATLPMHEFDPWWGSDRHTGGATRSMRRTKNNRTSPYTSKPPKVRSDWTYLPGTRSPQDSSHRTSEGPSSGPGTSVLRMVLKVSTYFQRMVERGVKGHPQDGPGPLGGYDETRPRDCTWSTYQYLGSTF